MRYWIMSFTLILFAAIHSESQETKKKDDGGKDSKSEHKEPTEYLGKSFDQWREDLNFAKQKDPSKREAAMKAVLMFSLTKAGDAMPDIVADLKRHPKVNVDLSVRVNGIMALNTYFLHGANAKKKPDSTLVKDVLDMYKRFLKDPQVIVKERTVQGLKYIGPEARDLLDDVIPLAKDSSTWELRKEAIPILVLLAAKEKGPGDTKALTALRFVADPKNENSYVVRALAVTGLGIVGHDTALVDIKKALNDKSKDVRIAAVQAMVYSKDLALIDLKRVIDDKDQVQPKEVRLAAIPTYGAAGEEKALKGLSELLSHPDKDFRMAALNTIAQLAKHIKTQPKDLTFKKLEERIPVEKEPIINIWLHTTIMIALGGVDKQHMQAISPKLKHKDKPVRLTALQVIAMAGPKAKPFCYDPVMELINDADAHVAVSAIETLVHLHAYEAIPTLKMLMDDMKMRPEIREACETAIDHFDVLKMKEKNEKKTPPDKK